MAAFQMNTGLPWQQLESQASDFQNPANLWQHYANNQNAVLGLNAGIYGNTQTNYQGLRQEQDNLYSTIFNSYSKNLGDVLGMLAGTNSSNLRDIDTNYTALSGKTSQDMISRGLGNSTVQLNMQRAIEADRNRERTRSQEQFAQMGAGYMNQIGQNFIGSQERAAAARTALGSEQARFGASVTAPYPNADFYSRMAQMYGSQQAQPQNKNPWPGGSGGNWTAGPSAGPRPYSSPFAAGGGASGYGGGGYGGGYGGAGVGNQLSNGGFFGWDQGADVFNPNPNAAANEYGGQNFFNQELMGPPSGAPFSQPDDSYFDNQWANELAGNE